MSSNSDLAALAAARTAGDAADREAASLELRILAGAPLGRHRSAQETVLVAFGDGTLHRFQGGDAGERGSRPPGQWRGACDPVEVDRAWQALAGLDADAFRGRPAAPGEPVTHLQAQYGGQVAFGTWGPGAPGVLGDGGDALAPLRRLLAKAQVETVWSLSLTAGRIARVRNGLAIPLTFANAGRHPVDILLGPAGSGVDLRFRYAPDPGESPLQIDWIDVAAELPREAGLRLLAVPPGGEASAEAYLPVELPEATAWAGRFAYAQLELGERVAGRAVFAGLAFTDTFTFTAPQRG